MCANVSARESAMLKLPKRGGNGASQRERGGAGGGGKREEKITFAEYKYGLSNRTLQSIITSPEKKKNVLEQTAFWHEIKVVYFLALRANLVVMPV